MNCRPGDLAVVCTPGFRCDGRIIKVTELERHNGEPAWLYEPPILEADGVTQESFFDRVLKPIRPSNGEDEINKIAGRPAEDLLQVCDRLIQEFNHLAEQAERLK